MQVGYFNARKLSKQKRTWGENGDRPDRGEKQGTRLA